QALADDLRRHLNNEPIVARATPALVRASKWAQRNPGKAAVALLGPALVLMTTVYYYAEARRSQAELRAINQVLDAQLTRKQADGASDSREWIVASTLYGKALSLVQDNPASAAQELTAEILP